MNFIQQAFKGLNDYWRYIVGFIIIIFGWQFIGTIPLLVVAVMHSDDMNHFMLAGQNNFMDLSINANLFLFLIIFMFVGGMLALYMTINVLHKRSFTSLITSREKVDWKRIFFAFGLWFVISLIMISIGYFSNPEAYTWNFKPIPFLILVLISFLLMPFQTSFEEFLFRGYFMQGLGIATISKYFPIVILYIISAVGLLLSIETNYRYSINIVIKIASLLVLAKLFLMFKATFDKHVIPSKLYQLIYKAFNTFALPLVVTATAFGLLHGANPEVAKLGYMIMVYYIGTGLLLGILTLMDEGTELSLGFHAANNIVAAIFVTTNWTVFQTDALFIDTSEPSLGFETYIPIFIIYPIILFIFSKKYAWQNWKEKLFGRIIKPTNEKDSFFKDENLLEL